MFKFVPVLLTILLATIATPARADTEEQRAVKAATNRAMYDRTRFVCLAGGVQMDAYEKVVPAEVIASQGKLKSLYPEFWAVVHKEGFNEADFLMNRVDAGLLRKQCDFMKTEILKMTPVP